MALKEQREELRRENEKIVPLSAARVPYPNQELQQFQVKHLRNKTTVQTDKKE